MEQALFVLDETPGLLEAVMSRVMERVEFHLKKRAGELLQAEVHHIYQRTGNTGNDIGGRGAFKGI